jgi:hypothetical protein
MKDWTHLIDVVLYDGGPNHTCRAGKETERNFFQRSQVEADPTKSRVDEDVADRNENDER